MVKRADRVYCISESVREQLSHAICQKRLKLTSTGVDPKIFFNSHARRKKQLIQIGQLMWYKGHRYLLEAMPLILEKHPDYELLIIGKGPCQREITDHIKELDLGENVKMKASLSHDALRTIYNESKLLVMPSLYEGLPKVLLEGFACGLPAVITEACNASDIAVNRAIVVRKESSNALADAVCRMLDDSNKWEEYSRECTRIAETHDWKIISSRIFNDYRMIVADA